jgi:hypothetical protein
MKIIPKRLSLRGDLIDTEQVDVLLKMATNSSLEVRLSTIDTLTHLPIQLEMWSQVVKIIEREITRATSIPDITALLKMGNFVPYDFNFDEAMEQINLDSKARKQILQKIQDENEGYIKQNEIDIEWASSQAPGFTIYSASELSSLRKEMYSEIEALRIPKDTFRSMEKIPDDAVDRPVLITLIMELARKNKGRIRIIGNELLMYLAKFDNFRPDLNGLFREYLKAAFEYCDGINRRIGRWFLSERWNPGLHPSWHLWQIAWTVSRGGLSGLIPALSRHLLSGNEAQQLTTLALIADSADHVLQRQPALFGGGAIRSRLSPKLPLNFWISGVRGMVNKKLEKKSVHIGVSCNKKVERGQSFIARLVAYSPRLKDKAEKRLGGGLQSKPIIDVNSTECNWPIGQKVTIRLAAEGIDVQECSQTFNWNGYFEEVVFSCKADFEYSPKLTTLKFYVIINELIVASPILEVRFAKKEDTIMKVSLNIMAAKSIFISYCRNNLHEIKNAIRAFMMGGASVFLDQRDIVPSSEWRSQIKKAIKDSDIFLLFWSEDAAKSKHVKWELKLGIKYKSIDRIKLFCIEDIKPPKYLADLQCGDLLLNA